MGAAAWTGCGEWCLAEIDTWLWQNDTWRIWLFFQAKNTVNIVDGCCFCTQISYKQQADDTRDVSCSSIISSSNLRQTFEMSQKRKTKGNANTNLFRANKLSYAMLCYARLCKQGCTRCGGRKTETKPVVCWPPIDVNRLSTVSCFVWFHFF